MAGGFLKNFRRLRRRIIRGDPLACAIRKPPLIRNHSAIRGGGLWRGAFLSGIGLIHYFPEVLVLPYEYDCRTVYNMIGSSNVQV